jgi:lysophospholipase L1-like esterase
MPSPRPLRLLCCLLLSLTASVLSAAPEKWADAINAFVKADAAHPPAKGGVVFVGSSSIVKWTTLAQDFPGVPVIQRGFGGSDLSDSVFYADKIVTPYQPRVVVVYAGENDLWAGKSADALLGDFKAFNQKVHAAVPNARIAFIGLKPSPSRIRIRAEVIRANQLISDECAKDKRLVFVNVFQPMLDAQGKDRPELYVEDQLHMKPAGYAIWTPLVAKAIK